ncbi:fimbria/pilus outer membrane usher protein [Sphingorhabdus sp.]|uniref:fimbria/pilus outer membrane usher protein n=1 Tax=Sphingorhabdus sp. TaxID=1902408 RepID=UPI00333F5AEA
MALGICLASLCSSGVAAATDRTLVLEIILNGRATGRVAEFLERDGLLFARKSELRAFGLRVAEDGLESDLVSLSTLVSVRFRIDEASQNLELTAGNLALRPIELAAEEQVYEDGVEPLITGGSVLNYDAVSTWAQGRLNVQALLDFKTFGRFGMLRNIGVVQLGSSEGQGPYTRLTTTYAYTDPDHMRRWSAGDITSGALSWNRTLRLGGAKVESDFAMRPDIVTYPLPGLEGSVTAPSTIDVLVNGVRQLSQPVQAGPFRVRTIPMVTGAGEIALSVRDVLGRENVVVQKFYVNPALLTPGLNSYSWEVGAIRQNFGAPGDHYGPLAMIASARRGISNAITVEAHAEATDRLLLAGLGGVATLGNFGVAEIAVSRSASRAGPTSAHPRDQSRSGTSISVGLSRSAPRLNLGVRAAYTSPGYEDIAANLGEPLRKYSINANMAFAVGARSNILFAYIRQSAFRPLPSGPLPLADSNAITTQIFSGSFRNAIRPGVFFSASALASTGIDRNYIANIALTFRFGGHKLARVEATQNAGRQALSASFSKPILAPYDYGYRITRMMGDNPYMSADLDYDGSIGHSAISVEQRAGAISGRVGMRGAIILSAEDVFFSDQIDDSFAVVRTGTVPGISVYYENRYVGLTNAKGNLLVPSLRTYQNNKLSLKVADFPLDVSADMESVTIRPAEQSGSVVDFGVRRLSAALVMIHDVGGVPIALGSTVRVDGRDPQPVGQDGAAFIPELRATNNLVADLPDGTRCVVQFAFVAIKGDIPTIGPLICR